MADQRPVYGNEPARTYDDRMDSFIAFLGAVLLVAGIIALFMFITWVTYAAD